MLLKTSPPWRPFTHGHEVITANITFYTRSSQQTSPLNQCLYSHILLVIYISKTLQFHFAHLRSSKLIKSSFVFCLCQIYSFATEFAHGFKLPSATAIVTVILRFLEALKPSRDDKCAVLGVFVRNFLQY